MDGKSVNHHWEVEGVLTDLTRANYHILRLIQFNCIWKGDRREAEEGNLTVIVLLDFTCTNQKWILYPSSRAVFIFS